MGILNRLYYHLGKAWSHNSAALALNIQAASSESNPLPVNMTGNIYTIIPTASTGLWSTVSSSFLALSLTATFFFTLPLQGKAYLGTYNLHFKYIFQDLSLKAAQHMKISTGIHTRIKLQTPRFWALTNESTRGKAKWQSSENTPEENGSG